MLQKDYDNEVIELLARIPSEYAASQVSCDEVFEEAIKHFPVALGGIDWTRTKMLTSVSTTSLESPDEILGLAAQFVSVVGRCDRVYLVSDDYYSIGLECSVNAIRNVLEAWLSIPHAIFAFSLDFKFVFHVSMVRSAYIGKSLGGGKGIERGA